MKLQYKLLLVLFLMAFVPPTLMQWRGYWLVRSNLEQSSLDELKRLAGEKETIITRVVEDQLEQVILYANKASLVYALGNYLKNNEEEYRLELTELVGRKDKNVKSVMILSNEGRVIESTDRSMRDSDMSQDDVFKRVIEGNNLSLKVDDGVLLFVHGHPVSLGGERVGVVIMEMYAGGVLGVIQDYSDLGETGEALIVERAEDGNARILTPLRRDETEKASIRFESGLGIPAKMALEQSVDTIIGSVDYSGVEVNAATEYIVPVDWGLVVKMDREEILAPANEYLRQIIMGQSVYLLLALVISYLFAITITRPVNDLLVAAKQISKGDLTQKVRKVTGDEVGQLGAAFNEMAGKLQQSHAVMQEKIAKATTELAEKLKLLEKKQQESEKSKTAMLNLLEDSRMLEEQLKVEKEGVEDKVKSRTRELLQKTEALEKTQKKVSEGWLKLQQEKARMMASIGALNMGFVMTDNENNILYANPAVDVILGSVDEGGSTWTMDMLVERFGEVFDPNACCQEVVHSKQEIERKEIVYGNKFLRVFVAPILMREDIVRVIGTVMLIEDITEPKRLQKTRDEFFSVASHELRTPLTAIRGNSAMMKEYYFDEIDNKDVKQMVNDIHSASKRLISIVNDFLDASRLELDKMELRPVEFDVVELVKSAMHDLENVARDKGFSWDLEYNAGDYKITADKDRTLQVVVNLLGNALKYTNRGGVRVWIEGDEKLVRVKVTDTGLGIANDQQQHLFQKFKQVGAKGHTRNVSQSTGMGLYVTKLLMEAMGGKVYLEWSEQGKGSTFTVEMSRGV